MRWIVAIGAGLAVLGVAVFIWATREPPSLTVASWGGAYTRAQAIALFRPFTEATGIEIRGADYSGGTKQIADQIAANEVAWNLVDMELPDADAACRDGLLERLDGASDGTASPQASPPAGREGVSDAARVAKTLELHAGADGASAAEDFVPGALGPCWVGTMVYSQIVAFHPARVAQPLPERLADFFDLARFPGKRGLKRTSPRFNLEMALMADGVAPGEVYAALATQEGVARALAKLDAIKPEIAWWRTSAEPIAFLKRGEVAMTTALNGRLFDARLVEGLALRAIWDGQVYELDVFAIPKDAPDRARTLEFLRFATAPAPLAEQARWLSYGPARRSSVALVTTHPEQNFAMRAHLPTAPENFATALLADPAWWREHGAEIQARWDDWASGE